MTCFRRSIVYKQYSIFFTVVSIGCIKVLTFFCSLPHWPFKHYEKTWPKELDVEVAAIVNTLQIAVMFCWAIFFYCCYCVYKVVEHYRESSFSVLDEVDSSNFVIEDPTTENANSDFDDPAKGPTDCFSGDKNEAIEENTDDPLPVLVNNQYDGSFFESVHILSMFLMQSFLITIGCIYVCIALDYQQNLLCVLLHTGFIVGAIMQTRENLGSCYSFALFLLACAEFVIIWENVDTLMSNPYDAVVQVMIFFSGFLAIGASSPMFVRDVCVSFVGVGIFTSYNAMLYIFYLTQRDILKQRYFHSTAYVITFVVLPFLKALNLLIIVHVLQNKTLFFYLLVACGFDIIISIAEPTFTVFNSVNCILFGLVLIIVTYAIFCKKTSSNAQKHHV